MDGHERPNVRQARTEFLAKKKQLEELMPIFEGEDMHEVEPTLAPGQKKHIWVVQDESCYSANDGTRHSWVNTTSRDGQVLQKKTKGKSLMVSDFLCETYGRLKIPADQQQEYLQQHPNASCEARQFFKPGANADGYWTGAHVISQVCDRAIPIFEKLHPGCTGVFVFDNSTAHDARPADALYATSLNKNDGGKPLKTAMRDGWFIDSEGIKHNQAMQYPDGKRKGMVTVLRERGFHDEIIPKRAECEECKTVAGLARDIEPNNQDECACCLRRLTWLQPDFQENYKISLLEEKVHAAGHICLFLPKFHPELNFIELYWGVSKQRTRKRCDYTFRSLLQVVPEELDAVADDLPLIRRLARNTWRYMSAYENGLTGVVAENAVKQFRGHRTVSLQALRSVQ
jgi:hypothetical protein